MRSHVSDVIAGSPGVAAFLLGLSIATGAGATEPVPAPVSVPATQKGSTSAVAAQTVDAFDRLFQGPHAGARAVHTKGILAEGTFVPTEQAALLSRAVHFHGPAIPVVVRFSNFSGLPANVDGDAASNPRGMSIKFVLPDGGDTDIVAHSYNGFPAATPEDFLEFLRVLGSQDASRIDRFLATHPAAQTFAAAPNRSPQSYAREFYYGVNAFRFTNDAGVSHYGRYRLEPIAGAAYLGPTDVAAKSRDYLAQELRQRVRREPARFRLLIQLARPSDPVNDGTMVWPDDRTVINAGTLTLNRTVTDDAARQRALLFTPLNLVGGIAPSADPMLVARTRAYRVSFERRHGIHADEKDK